MPDRLNPGITETPCAIPATIPSTKFNSEGKFGYNFLPSEISAAFALEQVKKLKNNIKIRDKNFKFLKNFFRNYKNYFKLPERYDFVRTPWLAFPLVIRENRKFNRKQLQIFFEDKKKL